MFVLLALIHFLATVSGIIITVLIGIWPSWTRMWEGQRDDVSAIRRTAPDGVRHPLAEPGHSQCLCRFLFHRGKCKHMSYKGRQPAFRVIRARVSSTTHRLRSVLCTQKTASHWGHQCWPKLILRLPFSSKSASLVCIYSICL